MKITDEFEIEYDYCIDEEIVYDSFTLKIKDRETTITDDEAKLLIDYITEKLKGN